MEGTHASSSSLDLDHDYVYEYVYKYEYEPLHSGCAASGVGIMI
jgi:hypothetical protein